MNALKIYKWTFILLFIYSILSLAVSLTAMLAEDLLSLELSSALGSFFVTGSQQAALSAIVSIVGCVTAFLGLGTFGFSFVSTPSKQGMQILFCIYLVSAVFLLAQVSPFPWVAGILLLLLMGGFLYGQTGLNKK